MDSNVGALKNKIAQLRRLVADLRGELVFTQKPIESNGTFVLVMYILYLVK